MNDYFYTYPNETICSILEAMRKCHETRNYSYLPGLIEHAQYVANRMETALADKRDIREWSVKREELKKEIRALRAERAQLTTKDDKTDD